MNVLLNLAGHQIWIIPKQVPGLGHVDHAFINRIDVNILIGRVLAENLQHLHAALDIEVHVGLNQQQIRCLPSCWQLSGPHDIAQAILLLSQGRSGHDQARAPLGPRLAGHDGQDGFHRIQSQAQRFA